MTGETDLNTLLVKMDPFLHEQEYVYCCLDTEVYQALEFAPPGVFHEQEGVTVITTRQQAMDSGLTFDAVWACITLNVHSSLSAVGFLAAITGRLAQAGISVNPVSAYYHDHLFVPWESRRLAMEVLSAMVSNASNKFPR